MMGELQQRCNVKIAQNLAKRWQVFGYDLRGNDLDGYEVNNMYPLCEVRADLESMDDERVIRILQRQGVLIVHTPNGRFDVDGNNGCLFVNCDGIPVCELRLIT